MRHKWRPAEQCPPSPVLGEQCFGVLRERDTLLHTPAALLLPPALTTLTARRECEQAGPNEHGELVSVRQALVAAGNLNLIPPLTPHWKLGLRKYVLDTLEISWCPTTQA